MFSYVNVIVLDDPFVSVVPCVLPSVVLDPSLSEIDCVNELPDVYESKDPFDHPLLLPQPAFHPAESPDPEKPKFEFVPSLLLKFVPLEFDVLFVLELLTLLFTDLEKVAEMLSFTAELSFSPNATDNFE